MAQEKYRLEGFPCRLEADQIAFITDLADNKILGKDKSAVLRALVNYAMTDMAKTQFIQNFRAMRTAARKA